VTCPGHAYPAGTPIGQFAVVGGRPRAGHNTASPRPARTKQPLTQRRRYATPLIMPLDFRYFEIFARILFVCFFYKIFK
jgi:hypothetical protein